jgi:hypothetical protein
MTKSKYYPMFEEIGHRLLGESLLMQVRANSHSWHSLLIWLVEQMGRVERTDGE